MPGVFADGPYLSPGGAARLLLVSPKTLARWANEGRIPCALTLGGHRRFRVDVIAALAASMRVHDRREPDEAS